MKKSLISTSVIALGTAMLVACSNDPGQASRADAPASPMAGDPVDKENTRVAEARAFLERADAELGQMSKEVSPVFWEQATNITDETNAAAAEAGARATTLAVSLANESKQFNDVDLPPILPER